MVALSERVVLEFETQDGLDVLRLAGDDDFLEEEPVAECFSIFVIVVHSALQQPVFFGGFDGLEHAIDAEDQVLVGDVAGERLAAVFKLEASALDVQTDLAVGKVGG